MTRNEYLEYPREKEESMNYTRATMPDKPNLAISPERRAMLDAAITQLRRTADAEGDIRRRWHEEHPCAASRRYLEVMS